MGLSETPPSQSVMVQCSKHTRPDRGPHVANLYANGELHCRVHGTFIVPLCSRGDRHDVPVMAVKCDSRGIWLCSDCLTNNRSQPLQPSDVQRQLQREQLEEAGRRLLERRKQLRES